MTDTIDTSPGAVTRVPGFRAAAVACGLKESGQPDLALVACDRPAAAAAMLTTNAFKAAPVVYDAALLSHSQNAMQIQAVLINAGNANACTGERGLRDAERMAHLAEAALGLPAGSALVMSTGVIGHPMPMDKVEAGIRAAAAALSADGGAAAARAIMTTDVVPKEAFVQIQLGGVTVSIGGMIKGSGMIHPSLARADQLHATMLGLIVTDAAIPPDVLSRALERATAASFNRITVDGDTSTNDTILLLASGRAGNPAIDGGAPLAAGANVGVPLAGTPGTDVGASLADAPRAGASPAPTGSPGAGTNVGVPLAGTPGTDVAAPLAGAPAGDYAAFEAALTGVCVSLAKQIARDGEGATRLVEIVVRGADGDAEAERAAKTVATSPLVKTAIFGADPNWGRVLAAIGRSGIRVEPERVSLWLGPVQLVAGGEPLAFDGEAARAALKLPEVRFLADLGLGAGQATVWTCDLSYKYVEINAEYHT
jgi:glutamate N-acetyltransferase/amino-acid N-acetyltransferase